MAKISRRDFLRAGALGTLSAVLAGCQWPPRWVTLEPYVRPPEEQLSGEATWYASSCRECPAGCGIITRVMNGRALKVEGNPEHPLNQGKLCAKGQAMLQLLYNPDRLAGPVRQASRGSRQFQPLKWDEAIGALADKLQGAGSGVAIWGAASMSGHLYDLFKRMTDALGAQAPIIFDLYTSLQGYQILSRVNQDVLGQGLLPTYDISRADAVLSFGADFLGTWLSPVRYGIDYGRMRGQPQGKRGYLVQMEPRQSITGAKADWWLPIRPGSEGLVAQAIARIIADQKLGPADRAAAAGKAAGAVDVESVAQASDISVQDLTRLARIFAQAEHPLAIPGSSLAGMDGGAQAISAVQALNLIAGTIGQPGGMSLSAETNLPGLVKPALSSLADAQKLIDRMKAGEIKVLLVHGANPAYELPPKLGFAEALAKVPFVVSFSSLADETAVQADLVLPDRTSLESWGYTIVSPSFGQPVVSSQQPVVTPVVDAQATGDVLLAAAQRIPAAAAKLTWKDEVAFLKDAVTQLPAGAAGGSGADVLWARFLQHGGWWPASPPAPAALKPNPAATQVAAATFQGDAQQYPLIFYPYVSTLLGGGRGASLPWLQGAPDPMTTVSWQTWVEINPATAAQLRVSDGDVVKVTSPQGEIEAVVYTYPAIRPDTVAIPTGQGHTDSGRYAHGQGSNLAALFGAQTEGAGTGPAWSTLRVRITPTGKKTRLVAFENKEGATQGFINAGFPGQ